MPKKIDHDKQREIFAQAAFRVLVRKGLADTTLRDVANEAGFTTGALAHYVHTKDELLLAAVKHMSDRIFLELTKEEAFHDVEAFRRVLHGALPISPTQKVFWRVNFNFWERAQQDDAMRNLLQTSYARWQSYLMRFLRVLRDDGKISSQLDLQEVAQSAIALVDGIAVRTLVAGLDTAPRKSTKLVDAWIERTLGYKPRPLRRPRKA